MSLAGKRALITGSTSGIGQGIAEALAEQGADIVLHGLGDPGEIEKIRANIATKYKVTCTFAPGNLADAAGVAEMMAHAGEIDILVNNAGVQHVAPVHEMPGAAWEKVIAINLSAPFYAIKETIPYMYKKGWGRIINVASTQGLVGSVNKAPYNASKHGLVGMTKTIALEAAETGVTCNAVCPGWVLTPLVLAQIEARADISGKTIDEEKALLCGEKHATKRFTTVEQIGATAVFLCSPAGDNMTGTQLTLDGGWTAT